MQRGKELEERIPLFAARCVNVCEAIPAKRLKAGHFKDQLFRSATGVSANYAEAEASVATARRKLEGEGNAEI